MSPRQAKSLFANSDRRRSGGRHDIGYARSGVAVGILAPLSLLIERKAGSLVTGGKRVAQR
jgi:hypothetical protein